MVHALLYLNIFVSVSILKAIDLLILCHSFCLTASKSKIKMRLANCQFDSAYRHLKGKA